MAKQSISKTWAFLIIGFLILVAVILLMSGRDRSTIADNYANEEDKSTVTYTCADGKSLSAVFVDEGDSYVEVSLNDGRELHLPNDEEVEDENRYAKVYGTTVFWSDGNEAWLEEEGNRTYQDCTASN